MLPELKTNLLSVIILLCCVFGAARAAEDDIDWRKTQDLFQRSNRGEKLAPEDQKYLDHAKEVRKKLIAEGKAPWRDQANAQQGGGALIGKSPTGLIPLTELGTGKYKGEDGGLYGGGKNEPPAEHAAAAAKELAKIVPLDADGKPSANGKIVLIGIGMSNTTQEFSKFKELADKDVEKAKDLVIVDAAQGGQAARQWANDAVWQTAEKRVQAAGVTDKQVQVAWIKQANIQPSGDLQDHARQLQKDMETLLHLAKKHYPNLRVAYLSSRTYGGYAKTRLNLEPYAYEGAFAMRWLIQDQIKKEAKLNYNESRGEVVAPLLLWGPYLWADGTTPRKDDGFLWEQKDFRDNDGTHPSDSGRQKVAELLLKFFKADAGAKKWFEGK
jgi:hypothetical protein